LVDKRLKAFTQGIGLQIHGSFNLKTFGGEKFFDLSQLAGDGRQL
jgi:hypothetical protein